MAGRYTITADTTISNAPSSKGFLKALEAPDPTGPVFNWPGEEEADGEAELTFRTWIYRGQADLAPDPPILAVAELIAEFFTGLRLSYCAEPVNRR